MMHHVRAHTYGAGTERVATHAHPGPPAMLEALADRVSRLSPSHRDPHRFHEDKSEVVAELRRLARLLGRVA